MQTFLAKQRQFIIAAMIFSLFGTGAAFALPYTPGETLNPTCSPGSANCSVNTLHSYSAPTATADYGLLSIGNGLFDGTTSGHFSGSSSGTYLAVNAASGYAGNLIDLQVAGSSKFKVTNDGTTTIVGSTSIGSSSLGSANSLTIRGGSLSASEYSTRWLRSNGTVALQISNTGVIYNPTSSGSLIMGDSTNTFSNIIGANSIISTSDSTLSLSAGSVQQSLFMGRYLNFSGGANDIRYHVFGSGISTSSKLTVATYLGEAGSFQVGYATTVPYFIIGPGDGTAGSVGKVSIGNFSATTGTGLLNLRGAGSTSSTITASLFNTTREYMRIYDDEHLHTKGKIIIDQAQDTGDWTDFWSATQSLAIRTKLTDTITTNDYGTTMWMDMYGSSASTNRDYTNFRTGFTYTATSATTSRIRNIQSGPFFSASGSGTIGSVMSFSSDTWFPSGGSTTVTNFYSYYSNMLRQSGTISNYYSFYAVDQNGASSSNAYGMYVASSNLKSYFAGAVGIGTDTTPDAMIDIVGTGSTSSTLTASLSSTTREFFRIYDDETVWSRGKLLIDNYNVTDTWTDGWTFTKTAVFRGTTDDTTAFTESVSSDFHMTGSSVSSNKSYTNFDAATFYDATSTTANVLTGITSATRLTATSAGTVASSRLFNGLTWLQSSSNANITNAYGMYLDVLDQGAGSITNYYGVYIDTGSGASTLHYGIYVADTAYSNYFAYRVGIGADTTPDYLLEVEGDTADYVARLFNDGNATTRTGLLISAGLDDHTAASTSTLISFADGDGTTVGSITFGSSATAYNTTSDQRVKENIRDTSLSLSDLMRVQVRDYNFIADINKKTSQGFIAQELLQVYPQAVTVPEDPNGLYMVDYSKLMPLAIKSIQDLNLKVIDMESLTSETTLVTNLKIWLSNLDNGITELFAKKIKTDELCVGSVCVTEDTFLQMVNSYSSSSNSTNESNSSSLAPEESNSIEEPAPNSTPEESTPTE